jgi:hypothetical protein
MDVSTIYVSWNVEIGWRFFGKELSIEGFLEEVCLLVLLMFFVHVSTGGRARR